MSSLCLILITYIRCITLVHSIIIFNKDKFIIDTPFENIKNAVTSGNMKCGLENEDLKLHQNKYNRTHIIFSYRQKCDIRSMLDYAKKEDIYFNEFMRCNLRFVISTCNKRAFFEFDDTCSIEYSRACEDNLLGPCIPSPDNSIESSSSVILTLGNDAVEFTTEEIQRAIGDVITCDPNGVHDKMQVAKSYFDDNYQIFHYGRQMCVIDKTMFGECPPNLCCYPAVYNVQDKFGQKLHKKPVMENENFNK